MTGYLMLAVAGVLGTAGAYVLGRTLEGRRQNAAWGQILDAAESSAGVVDTAFRQAKEINATDDLDFDDDDAIEEFDRNRARPVREPVPVSSFGLDDEFMLHTIDHSRGELTYPNGWGVDLERQLTDPRLWNLTVVDAEGVSRKPFPARVLGKWAYELDGLTDAKAAKVCEKVRQLHPDAEPVDADVLYEKRQKRTRRSRKSREVASNG